MSRVTDHTHTKKIDGDSIVLFLVFQVERETIMIATMWHIDNIAWWCYMMKLYDDIMILYDDEMSWGHGDGYVVLRAPMDDLR